MGIPKEMKLNVEASLHELLYPCDPMSDQYYKKD